MNILGISAFYHDSAAVLIVDGKIVAAAQEERFTRKKHDFGFPRLAIANCLEIGGIEVSQLDYVAFYDKPFIKFERLLETYLTYAPVGLRSFLMAMPIWLKHKLWIGDILRKELDFDKEVIFPEHHQSHAASAFYPSPFEQAAFITMDGVGEWATSSWGVGRGHELRLEKEIRFPHSLGLLYSAITYFTGFRVNSGEYKVMGLAPYGEPKYKDLMLRELVDLKEDGSFRLNMKYFNYCAGLTMTSRAFDDLIGRPPRQPESELTQMDMDLARSVQEVTEEAVLRMARHVKKETGMDKLCLAGGVALNCVGNGKMLRANIFDDIWIQPAAGDAGGALGAALFVWHQLLGNERVGSQRDKQSGSYLGPSFGSEEISAWLSKNKYPFTVVDRAELPGRVAELLDNEKVVGWFGGRMEFGPRALGGRSIIGDARSPKMQSIMNLKIKYRESFRPFAPSCLAEDVGEFFDLDRESPYMLLVAPVKEERRKPMTSDQQSLFGIDKLNIARSDIPAITHIDYSARVQTVNKLDNPDYHAVIKAFKERTGYGIIINTSFNVRGEPIVCTPQDAYLCFMRTEMDVLVLENLVLEKEKQPALKDDADWRLQYELD
jgi:carbamoyltransferase